jgi:hypothetical protein
LRRGPVKTPAEAPLGPGAASLVTLASDHAEVRLALVFATVQTTVEMLDILELTLCPPYLPLANGAGNTSEAANGRKALLSKGLDWRARKDSNL